MRTKTIATGVLGFVQAAAAQSAGLLDLSWSTIDCGGGVSVGGGFTLTGTLGQPDAGSLAAGGLELAGGFLGGRPQPACYADCDGSGTLDIFDFLCFQDAFVAQDPYADCDGSTVFDIFDFLCFQDAFVTGCP
jgi:hypothetical protein